MLKIGDFSKFSQVSVKALRYYDQLGLLKPAQIDAFTGYRYYSASQLSVVNRILALKDLGFSLEQIAQMQGEELTLAQIQAMLKLKQAELQGHIAEEVARLARVEARLNQIEQEANMPTQEAIIKKVEAQQVAAARAIVPDIQIIGQTFERLFDQVAQYITRHGGKFAGPGIALYYDTEFREQNMQVEVAWPINGSLPESEQVKVYALPAVETMACLIHPGSFDNFSQSYATLLKWVEANGYQIIGPNREVYMQYERDGDPASYVTELQFPVAKTAR